VRTARALTLAAALLVSAALTAGFTTADAQPSHQRLEVMEFNIEYGGTLVDFDKVVEVIRKADPDVIGVEEADRSLPRLAKAIGYPYYDTGMQLISKYPLFEPSGSDGVYAFVEVAPDRVVAISNVHLPSDPYGPYWIRDGKSVDKVLALERRVRLPALERQLEVLPPLAAAGVPVFVTGDFNSPSHLDWTEAAVGTRPYLTAAVDWPVSQALEDAGFRDSYREAHPDPVANPGLTWWAARPKAPSWAGNATAKDPQDRIDFVYSIGPATTEDSIVAGERGFPDVELSVKPWPSDHRAVISTFDVVPATMPVLVAVDRRLVVAGTDLVVTFHAPGQAGERIAVVPAGSDPATSAVASSPTGPTGTTNGSISFPTTSLAPGAYEAALVSSGGAVLARIPFWVRAKGSRPEVTTSKSRYRVGEPIEVSWSNAPANRWDWLGVYRAPGHPATDSYLIWQYTGGASSGTLHGPPAGTMSLDGDTTYGKPWPLPPGRYEVIYLVSDTYKGVARASFTVRG